MKNSRSKKIRKKKRSEKFRSEIFFQVQVVLTFFVFYKIYFSKNKTLFFSREGHIIFEPRSNPRCPYTSGTPRFTLHSLNSRYQLISLQLSAAGPLSDSSIAGSNYNQLLSKINSGHSPTVGPGVDLLKNCLG